MKKNFDLNTVRRYLPSVLVILLGAVLAFSPDTASALLGIVAGWAVIIVGAVLVYRGATLRPVQLVTLLSGIVCLWLGGRLVRDPLILAAACGRLVGVLLALRSLSTLTEEGKGNASVLNVVSLVIGILLIFLPMTTSRLVFGILGVVVLAVGVAMLMQQLRQRRLESGL